MDTSQQLTLNKFQGDLDPLTVNINVTFNEVNFSSEEENVDVPDELDYNKRMKKEALIEK